MQYGQVGGGWGGGGSTGGATASITASGEITTVFTWRPDFAGDAPPDNVIIAETCTASWSGYAMSAPTGHCTNDLGFQEVDTSGTGPYPGSIQCSGQSSGTRYTVLPGSDTITITASPSASASASGSAFVTASVNYSAAAYPVLVRISPFWDYTFAPSVLVGQGETASLDTGPLQQAAWSWFVTGGNPFKDYYTTPANSSAPDSATYVEMGSETDSTCHFYFGKYTDGGSAQVRCSAHVVVPSGALPAGGLDVTGHLGVNVEKPSSTLSVYIGTTQGWPDPNNPQAMHLWGANDGQGTSGGILWIGTVSTPDRYTENYGQDYGGWNYTQLWSPQRYRTVNGTTMGWSWNGYTGLDTTFGYEPERPALYPADGSTHEEGDSPSQPFYAGATSVRAVDSFITYMLYLPPGDDCKLVPLKDWNWYWQGTGTWSCPTAGIWNIGGTNAQWGSLEDFPLHPVWTIRLDAAGGVWPP